MKWGLWASLSSVELEAQGWVEPALFAEALQGLLAQFGLRTPGAEDWRVVEGGIVLTLRGSKGDSSLVGSV